MCYVAITPEAFVCERHQETLTWSPMAKEILGYPLIGKFCIYVTGRYFTLFTCRFTCSLICVDYLDSEQLNCRCVLSVIGKCMFWVGQVKFGTLFNGILPNFGNIPSKCVLQQANVSLNLVS